MLIPYIECLKAITTNNTEYECDLYHEHCMAYNYKNKKENKHGNMRHTEITAAVEYYKDFLNRGILIDDDYNILLDIFKKSKDEYDGDRISLKNLQTKFNEQKKIYEDMEEEQMIKWLIQF